LAQIPVKQGNPSVRKVGRESGRALRFFEASHLELTLRDIARDAGEEAFVVLFELGECKL
jgi:hypothetical protein